MRVDLTPAAWVAGLSAEVAWRLVACSELAGDQAGDGGVDQRRRPVLLRRPAAFLPGLAVRKLLTGTIYVVRTFWK